MTVKQLVRYHTILMVHKIIMTSKPMYIHNRLETEHGYRTRSSTTGGIRLDQTYRYKTDLPIKRFRYRGTHDYNAIPAELRGIRNIQTFKTKLKRWIQTSMPPD